MLSSPFSVKWPDQPYAFQTEYSQDPSTGVFQAMRMAFPMLTKKNDLQASPNTAPSESNSLRPSVATRKHPAPAMPLLERRIPSAPKQHLPLAETTRRYSHEPQPARRLSTPMTPPATSEANEAAHLLAQAQDYGHSYQEDGVPLMDYTQLYSNGNEQAMYRNTYY